MNEGEGGLSPSHISFEYKTVGQYVLSPAPLPAHLLVNLYKQPILMNHFIYNIASQSVLSVLRHNCIGALWSLLKHISVVSSSVPNILSSHEK